MLTKLTAEEEREVPGAGRDKALSWQSPQTTTGRTGKKGCQPVTYLHALLAHPPPQIGLQGLLEKFSSKLILLKSREPRSLENLKDVAVVCLHPHVGELSSSGLHLGRAVPVCLGLHDASLPTQVAPLIKAASRVPSGSEFEIPLQKSMSDPCTGISLYNK